MATNDMQGKVCLVTGTSAGIGKVTARELAKMGATVVMICRSREKGEAVQAEIKEASRNERVDLIVADLSSLAEVRRAAQEFKQNYTQLHVLINNAGGVNSERKVTPDGLEATFVTNYLAPFLLTELLLDVLKASTPARVVNVSSSGHTVGNINFVDLQSEQRYNPVTAYAQSKLAQIYFTYELAERFEGTGITSRYSRLQLQQRFERLYAFRRGAGLLLYWHRCRERGTDFTLPGNIVRDRRCEWKVLL